MLAVWLCIFRIIIPRQSEFVASFEVSRFVFRAKHHRRTRRQFVFGDGFDAINLSGECFSLVAEGGRRRHFRPGAAGTTSSENKKACGPFSACLLPGEK
jgi:hypothetical protein